MGKIGIKIIRDIEEENKYNAVQVQKQRIYKIKKSEKMLSGKMEYQELVGLSFKHKKDAQKYIDEHRLEILRNPAN